MLVKSILPIFAGLGLVAGAPFEPRALGEDDVILVGDGVHQVMKLAEYEHLKARSVPAYSNNTVFTRYPNPPPAVNYNNHRRSLNFTGAPSLRAMKRQDCEESQEVQVDSTTNFQQWDVPMSSVVTASVDRARVDIGEGFELENSLTVGGGVEASYEKVISVSLKVDYGVKWTSTQTATYQFFVPAGKSGIVVSNPDTTRYKGRVLSGCTDNPQPIDFQSDVYTSASYGDLSWVKGIIRLCSSDNYPVPFCVGTGEHS